MLQFDHKSKIYASYHNSNISQYLAKFSSFSTTGINVEF